MDTATAARIVSALDLDLLAWDVSDALAKEPHDLGEHISMEEIKPELVAFVTACLRRVAVDGDAINSDTGLPHRFDDAPRAKSSHGGVLHIDTDGNTLYGGGVPFGHKAEMGPERCARCWELANGAERREDATFGRGYRRS